jgi:pimeloyl-ACP methyl ester carboxylesterase
LTVTGVHYLELPGQRLEYLLIEATRTAAPDLVMLHEGLGSLSHWRDLPERLAATTGSRVLVYSRRGYGRSTPVAQPRTPDYLHEEARIWLPLVLERLRIRTPVLFGHSDGASIALIHAAQPTSAVAGIIALAPHVRLEDVTLAGLDSARIAYETTDLRSRLAPHHADVDSTFRGWNQIWLDPAFRDWNIEGLLPSIRVPVLAIQGLEDEYGTLDQLERIRRALPATELIALANCRHSPHRDQPQAVLAAARRFIQRVEGRASGTQA